MPVAGRKPKADGEKRNRVKPVHDWTEVDDLPYDGPKPRLPRSRWVPDKGGPVEVNLSRLTRAWWRAISTMPHCRLWSASDWQFAIATAIVADDAFAGSTSAAAELRQREKILGTTYDARRDLRIRYVTPAGDADGISDAATATVTHLDDVRSRLLEDEDDDGDDAP